MEVIYDSEDEYSEAKPKRKPAASKGKARGAHRMVPIC